MAKAKPTKTVKTLGELLKAAGFFPVLKMVKLEADPLRDVLAWLEMHGAPSPRIVEETVGYPGGSYINHLAIFKAAGKTMNVGVPLMVLNPAVTLIELRAQKMAPGDPNERLVYVPPSWGAIAVPVPMRPHPSGDTEGILGDLWFEKAGDPTPVDDVYFSGPNDSYQPGTTYTPVPDGLTWIKVAPSSPFDRPKWVPHNTTPALPAAEQV